MHDTNFIKEVELMQNELPEETYEQLKNQIISLELNWKLWDGFEKAITKSALAFFIYYLSGDIVFTVLLLCLSIFIRWIVHDLTVAFALRKNLNHIGPDFVWTDRLLRQISEKGINQYVIKFIPTLLFIAAIIIYISD